MPGSDEKSREVMLKIAQIIEIEISYDACRADTYMIKCLPLNEPLNPAPIEPCPT